MKNSVENCLSRVVGEDVMVCAEGDVLLEVHIAFFVSVYLEYVDHGFVQSGKHVNHVLIVKLKKKS